MIETIFSKNPSANLFKMVNPNESKSANHGSQMNEISKEFSNIFNNFMPNQQNKILPHQIHMKQLENESNLAEKKMKTPFKRAATHVAIAYFIYLKSV